MNSIDTFPPDDMPLRARLPAMRPETEARLIRWALWQPGAMPWLLKRSAGYWEKSPAQHAADKDAHHASIEATAALDLMRHRIQEGDDKACVEHLNASLAKEGAR